MDDDEIYGRIWVSQLDLTVDSYRESTIPKPPPRNESLKPNLSETDYPNNLEEFSTKLCGDVMSQSCLSFEGESVENLDIDFPTFETSSNVESPTELLPPVSLKVDAVPFPKMPCFSELNDNVSLQYYGQIAQILQNLTASRKDRYGILLIDRFVLFKKPEHKVSKVQIPIDRISNIYWYSNTNSATKKDCNKFKIDTAVRSYKFQCSSHDNAGLWINHIGKLLIDRHGDIITEPPAHILKAIVTIEKVKGKRIFILEPHYTLAYYESEDDFCNDIAMHRIQLRSSGVRRDPLVNTDLDVITSYRKYRLSFESGEICDQWFSTLSTIIHKAIASTTVSASVKTGDTVMMEIYSNTSNRHCADCGADNPEWASVNLFVTLCSPCSGLHRGMGRNVSSVQGILTDESTWQDANVVKLFRIIGNRNANSFFLATNQSGGSTGADRRFVTDKYVRKKFIGRRDAIFSRCHEQQALDDELARVVQTDDVLRAMRLYHLGASVTRVDPVSGHSALEVAEQSRQPLQVAFLRNQPKNNVRDWRSELFERDEKMPDYGKGESQLQERTFICSLNGDKAELRTILIGSDYFKVLSCDGVGVDGGNLCDGVESGEIMAGGMNGGRMGGGGGDGRRSHGSSPKKSVAGGPRPSIGKTEICKVLYENVCLVREKQQPGTNLIHLTVVVRETEYWTVADGEQTINDIKLYNCNQDQSSDVRDFKNLIGQKMCPSFRPTTSFECIGWIILSTATDEWRPYLAVLNSNRHVDFHDPRQGLTGGNASHNSTLKLDLRKVQKIEELRDSNYESSCPFKMFNMVSMCLISSVIYHVRSDTKIAHEEHLDAFKQSWNKMDFGLSNQFLTKDNVPLAVHKMIQFLQLHVSRTEGPFRRVGSVKEAEKIYNELVKDPGSFMLKDCTAHDVASALKLFFRKLDDPLLTRKLFKSWIAGVEISDPEEQIHFYKNLVKQLPAVNYQTLRLLIFLLVEIIRNNHVTQMDASNLSTSFNTCLLISGNQDPSFSHMNLQVLPILLENYQFLFDVSQEELEKEDMIRRGLEQISNDKLPMGSTLLRQIYVDGQLGGYLKNAVKFDREKAAGGGEDLYTKQVVIDSSMTSEALKQQIFSEGLYPHTAVLFEERTVDETLMQRLVYPQENMCAVVTVAEIQDCKASRKWIYKLTSTTAACSSPTISVRDRIMPPFRGWGHLSASATKNKVFVELSDTGQLNLWKNDQTNSELLANFSIKNVLLYRSCKDSRRLVAFKDKKTTASTLSLTFPKLFQNFSFKSKSVYNYINFPEQSDYRNFLEYYDQMKTDDLIPIDQRPGMPRCV